MVGGRTRKGGGEREFGMGEVGEGSAMQEDEGQITKIKDSKEAKATATSLHIYRVSSRGLIISCCVSSGRKLCCGRRVGAFRGALTSPRSIIIHHEARFLPRHGQRTPLGRAQPVGRSFDCSSPNPSPVSHFSSPLGSSFAGQP
jgi:hypothetical protein